MNLTIRILIGMAAGIVVGLILQAAGATGTVTGFIVDVFDVGGRIFVASLQLMVVPLVLVSLICGASSLSDGASMGRLGGKTVALYLATTAIAITIALTIALIISPGEGAGGVPQQEYVARPAPSLPDVIVNIFPTNPIAAMAEGKMLQVIVFALLVGVAITRAGEAGARIKSFFEDINVILMQLIMMLINLAPYGVFCLMARLFSEVGWQQILELAKYFFTVVAALLIHLSVVYPTILVLLARVSPVTFFSKMRNAMLVAFSTSSSGATLPVTLRAVEQRLGVDNRVASFSVPLGATINMDGTAIMQGVATVFIAQFYGIDLVFTDFLMVVLTATLASIGTAAVPGVGLITLAMVLNQVGLPVEGIALIIGVDRLLDMMRTAVNVSGDATVATTVASSEDMLDRDVFNTDDNATVNQGKAQTSV